MRQVLLLLRPCCSVPPLCGDRCPPRSRLPACGLSRPVDSPLLRFLWLALATLALGPLASVAATAQVQANVQVAWTSDYTTMPPQQVCSSNGSVAGPYCQIHVHLSLSAMMFTPLSVTATEDSGGVHSVEARPLLGQYTTGPCPPGCTQSPSTSHFDVAWNTLDFHNRPHAIYVAGTCWLWAFPFPVPAQFEGGGSFSVGNLLIGSTVPANPEPILWQGNAGDPVELKATISSAYRANQAPRLRIYTSDQTGSPVKDVTLPAQAIGPGPTEVTYVWNGSQDWPLSGTAPKGVYLFRWDVPVSVQMEADCDKSGYLTLTSAGGEAGSDGDADNQNAQVTYTVADTPNQPGKTGHIDIYDPDLVLRCTTPLAENDLALGEHTVAVPATSVDRAGEYVFLVSADDKHADTDKGHRSRWALQCNQRRTVGYASGTANELVAICRPEYPLPCTMIVEVNRDPVLTETVNAPTTRHVLVDTTHFPDEDPNNAMVVTYKMISGGTTFKETWEVRIPYNRAYVLGNSRLNEAPLAINAIAGILGGTNHRVTSNTTDNKDAILGKLKDSTVFYTWTHGNAGRFVDCPDATTITAAEVQARCEAKHQPAAKPLLWIPDYNFVFIDACLTASTSALADAFGSTKAGHRDRAFLGWNTLVDSNHTNLVWSRELFLKLAMGLDLNTAMAIASKKATPYYKGEDGRKHAAVPGWHGDNLTKVHGVYQGVGLQWYHKLP